MADAAAASELARRLDHWGNERGWRGPDPYEGLNARRVPPVVKRTALGRRLLIQAVKRSPADLRGPLGIQPEADAATVALIASAYARNGFLEPSTAAERLRGAVALLDELRSPGYDEPCWGYHFEFQSRVVHYERGEPNTIATAFAGHAHLDAYEVLGEPDLLARARDVGRFFLTHIPQTPSEHGACFGYHPGDRSLIHNANMLVGALLSRLEAAGCADAAMRDAAEASLEFTLARQRPDGSWPYGERGDLKWVDGFHTGYVLDALRRFADGPIRASDAESAWRRGIDFYQRRMFLPDGAPKYFADSLFPLDSQSVAQGIQTLSLAAAHGAAEPDAAWRVFAFARRRMLRRDGLPVFQRRRFWVNRIPHARWVVAPLLLALSELLSPAARDAPGDARTAGATPLPVA